MSFDVAQQVADAVLYEGYVLYPYRASSDKNRVRFQFGVVAPRGYAEADGSETWEMQTEVLVRPTGAATIDVRVRALHLQTRLVEAADPDAPGGFRPVAELQAGTETWVSWDEATETAVDLADLALDALADGPVEAPIRLEASHDVEELHDGGRLVGRLIRSRQPVEGRVVVAGEPAGSTASGDLRRLRVRLENLTDFADTSGGRDAALRHSLLGCHTLLAVRDGAFISMTDPPPDAAAAVKASSNRHTWPVLVGAAGETGVVLSSPIILPDHPEIAPESPGDLFDATEIDEILTLRIMTLTEDEKREARATDPRARRIIDRADSMPPELMDKLHGAIRYLRGGPAGIADVRPAPEEPLFPTLMTTSDGQPIDLPASVWQPEARVAPELATVDVKGVSVGKGSSVRLLPVRRADSMDYFLLGRVATVEAVFESVDDETFVAVTIDDDPATDLHRSAGRFFYFQPDELEPVS